VKVPRKAKEQIKKRKVEKVKGEIERLRPILEKMRIEDIVKDIREDREGSKMLPNSFWNS